jgi:hypothetical protein
LRAVAACVGVCLGMAVAVVGCVSGQGGPQTDGDPAGTTGTATDGDSTASTDSTGATDSDASGDTVPECIEGVCADDCNQIIDFGCGANEVCSAGVCIAVDCRRDADCAGSLDDREARCIRNVCYAGCDLSVACGEGLARDFTTCGCVAPSRCQLAVEPFDGVLAFGALSVGEARCLPVTFEVEGLCPVQPELGRGPGLKIFSLGFASGTDRTQWTLRGAPARGSRLRPGFPTTFEVCFAYAGQSDAQPETALTLVTDEVTTPSRILRCEATVLAPGGF